MRRYEPPDLLWFAILSLALFLPLSFVDLVGEGHSLIDYIRRLANGSRVWASISGIIVLVPMLAVPAAGFGWWAQGVAVRRGLRLTGRPDAPQKADYDDAPGGPGPG